MSKACAAVMLCPIELVKLTHLLHAGARVQKANAGKLWKLPLSFAISELLQIALTILQSYRACFTAMKGWLRPRYGNIESAQ